MLKVEKDVLMDREMNDEEITQNDVNKTTLNDKVHCVSKRGRPKKNINCNSKKRVRALANIVTLLNLCNFLHHRK